MPYRQSTYTQLFRALTPHFPALFPSTRISLNLPTSPEHYIPSAVIDALDQPIWNFLATFALHSGPEEQQILVSVLRDKILDTVMSANQNWAEGGARRIANVNLVSWN
jgi:DNA topoisomerase 2-associated protein PAT1